MNKNPSPIRIKPPYTFETENLLLRLPILEDAESIFQQYGQDEDITRYLIWQPHKNIDDTKEFLERCQTSWNSGSDFPWAIIRKEDKRLIGMAAIRINEHGVNLGYLLAKPYWGLGYMVEALQPIIDWAYSHDDVYRVWAFCDIENIASARLLEKVGLQKEGILRRWIVLPNRSNEPRDCFCYSKTK